MNILSARPITHDENATAHMHKASSGKGLSARSDNAPLKSAPQQQQVGAPVKGAAPTTRRALGDITNGGGKQANAQKPGSVSKPTAVLQGSQPLVASLKPLHAPLQAVVVPRLPATNKTVQIQQVKPAALPALADATMESIDALLLPEAESAKGDGQFVEYVDEELIEGSRLMQQHFPKGKDLFQLTTRPRSPVMWEAQAKINAELASKIEGVGDLSLVDDFDLTF